MLDDTKTRLIDAAGEAFAARGYDAVGVREICQQAGANVASVSYHFGDKHGLYVACLRHAQSCRVDDLTPTQWPADFSPADKLRAFVHAMLESKLASSRPRWHLELMLREMVRPTDACREIVEDYIRPLAETLAGVLQELLPGSKSLSENRPKRGGQAHFAPKAPQNEPDPAGSRIGSKWNQQTWLIGFSVVSQVLFYYVHQPVVRILMGPEALESLMLDALTDHITRYSLAAIGQGPPVTVDLQPPVPLSEGTTP